MENREGCDMVWITEGWNEGWRGAIRDGWEGCYEGWMSGRGVMSDGWLRGVL